MIKEPYLYRNTGMSLEGSLSSHAPTYWQRALRVSGGAPLCRLGMVMNSTVDAEREWIVGRFMHIKGES